MEEKEASSSTAELAVSKQSTTSQNRRRDHPILPGEIRQLFSLPESIIYYIAMHPSNAKVYEKLIRTCKYFYNQNPILVVDRLCNWRWGYMSAIKDAKYMSRKRDSNNEEYDSEDSSEEDSREEDASEEDSSEEDSTDSSSEDDSSEDDASEDGSEGSESDEVDCRKIVWNVVLEKSDYYEHDVNMNMVPYKFWVTDYARISGFDDELLQTAAAFIVPKIYRSDAPNFDLVNQILTLDELLILGSNARGFYFCDVKIIENDGKTQVMFEKVIERFPKLQTISWNIFQAENQNISCFSKNTAAELIKIPHFANITCFSLYTFQMFDAKVLFDYLKTCNKNMEVYLNYIGDLSNEFKQKLDAIMDEVISTQNFTYKPPFIDYKYCDQNKRNQIHEIHNRYVNTRF